MRIRNKFKFRSQKPNRKSAVTSHRPTWITVAIALYTTFLILSTIAFTADRTIESKMQDSYEYHLRYTQDGRQTHYYVERINTSEIGKIDLVYTSSSNSLVVETYNIKVLHIYCRSMYKDECKDVFGIDPSDNSNYYKWYFIEKNHLNVNIDADFEIEELSFIDTPFAYKVIVNGESLEEGTDYTYNLETSGTALSNVPSGHTRVDLYFKPLAGTPPTAILSASKTMATVDQSISFDASQSFDSDGSIIAHSFDFGDGTFKGGSQHVYQYSKPGIYGVILTVRDNDYLIDHAYVNITVVKSSDIPEIQGIVPDQVTPEDSPPWSLNLNMYEPIALSGGVEFYWYITGEDASLYTVTGENGTEDRLVFTLKPDAFGNDSVTLWLWSTEEITVSQPLWINITPVNDPPIISNLPDLIVHYDDPYTFNYEPYVFDKETPRNKLTLNIFDGYDNTYISVYGLNATFNYPQELVGEIVYATVTVSDTEAIAQDVINIQVTSDYVPKLTKSLPDVWLYEGTTKYNVFDLDDYFTDPDNDAIYFSFGQTHLNISINIDHTVDISAESEWTGSELVTFRARDPIGALAEDSIVVTVLPVNDIPIIRNVPNFYIRYELDYRFDLTPYVHDNDNATSELIIITLDIDHIRLDSFNKLVIIMNYPIEYLNLTVPLRLTVFDGLDSSFQDITVTITDDFQPELIMPLPDVVFMEDIQHRNAFNLDSYFIDIDGDALFYTTGNKYINITINTDHSVDFSAPRDWFGSELTYFRATDPTGGLQEDLVTVTVLPVNDAPRILPIPEQHGNESVRWVLDLGPYIIDVDNNLTELSITVDSDFIVVSGSTLIFLGSRELPNQIEVLVSDGEFSASQMIAVHLSVAKGPRELTNWDLLIYILPFLIIIILITGIIAGIVYRKKSRFTAEEVFLIHTGGTLINHLSRHTKANVDDVIFSGMFTAVQEFIKDTFAQDDQQCDDLDKNKWALDELKLGEDKILIERSENAYLAVIFWGEGSKRLRRVVNRLLDQIESKYEKVLPTWDGNIRALAGTKEILSVLIEPLAESKGQTANDVENKDFKKVTKPVYTPPPITSPPVPQTTGTQRSIVVPKASPVKSRPIEVAMALELKELLECTREHTGADKPGLAAWKLGRNNNIDRKNKISPNSDTKGINQIPMAFNINPRKQQLKTVAIKKSKPLAITKGEKTDQQLNGTLSFEGEMIGPTKPVKIAMPDTDKKLELDPARSFLQQLAELYDKY